MTKAHTGAKLVDLHGGVSRSWPACTFSDRRRTRAKRCAFALVSFLVSSIPGVAQPAKVQEAVDILLKLCVAGGERIVISGGGDTGVDISLKKLDVMGQVRGEIKIDKTEARGLVDGLSSALSQISAEQADKVRECIKPYRDAIMSLILGTMPAVPERKTLPPALTTEDKLQPKQPAPKAENALETALNQRLHSAIVRYVNTIKVTKSRWPENIGKNIWQIYDSGVSPKAMAVCILWPSTAPDKVSASRVEMSYSSRVQVTEEEARDEVIEKCNKWKVRKAARCRCDLVNVNGHIELNPPEEWMKVYLR